MDTPALIAKLLEPAAYPHAAGDVRLIETHISWVLIAGDYAYKIKKPLDLGFLDFSTLDKRKHFCEEEVRLNRRLAPDIYLDTVAIAGSETAPKIGGDGPALEWAVRMRAFDADSTLDRASQIGATQIDAIADTIARFHRDIPPAPADSAYGLPEQVMQPALENFAQIRALSPSDALDRLEQWTRQAGQQLAATFLERKHAGFIRECHGDLHLANIAWIDGAPLIFDCIEFNPDLRWIDVLSELAFLFMDLIHRGHAGLAWRLLNRYLDHTGDHAGLAVFRFYLVYRAMVRAKVAGIRAQQGDAASHKEAAQYLELAARLSRIDKPALLLMHGVSGSGKTWLSQQILERLGAVRLRSDVERKRLFGLGPLDSSAPIAGGIYTAPASAKTFQHLLELSDMVLRTGYPVIVDATFLKREHREPFTRLAECMDLPCQIVSLQVTEPVLRERVNQRIASGSDASEAGLAVLEAQLRSYTPLSPDEVGKSMIFDQQSSQQWPGQITELIRRLA